MTVIGLTGGIGSGKSTVAKVFEAMGCVLYNSDERAKAVYTEPAVKKSIVALLGAGAYLTDTQINAAYISSRIFGDATLLEKVNAIIHPAVKADQARFKARQAQDAILVKETALLFEVGLNKDVDLSVLVVAPVEIRVERVMKRSQMSREEVLKCMGSQWADERKMPLADKIIMNDGIAPVIPQVAAILQAIKS